MLIIKELIKISETKEEDLPLLLNEIKTDEGTAQLKKAINGESWNKLNSINDLRLLLDKESHRANLEYIIEEKENRAYNVFIKPSKSLNYIKLIFKIGGVA